MRRRDNKRLLIPCARQQSFQQCSTFRKEKRQDLALAIEKLKIHRVQRRPLSRWSVARARTEKTTKHTLRRKKFHSSGARASACCERGAAGDVDDDDARIF